MGSSPGPKADLVHKQGLSEGFEKGSCHHHASEEPGQSESPSPASPPPHARKRVLSSSATCLHDPLPPQKKAARTVQSKQNEKGSWRNSCPEVSSQAQRPHYKQNHPVTTGSLATWRRTGGGCSASSIWNLQARPGLAHTLPCSRKTGDSLSCAQQHRG